MAKAPLHTATDNRAQFRAKMMRLLGVKEVDFKIRKAYNINNKFLRR